MNTVSSNELRYGERNGMERNVTARFRYIDESPIERDGIERGKGAK